MKTHGFLLGANLRKNRGILRKLAWSHTNCLKSRLACDPGAHGPKTLFNDSIAWPVATNPLDKNT